ncbi:50S ribosomal protein L29 [Candidatus Woesearchaeota archaeon CG_4_10_14_0_2_um_filter_33_13]|nr:MAG: 50S ribosomal protein L29 [Candidatus Woesearchaeota archaeon CG_4_10_14_0_2_um_filter_33_13]
MKSTKDFRNMGKEDLASRLVDLKKDLLKLNVEVNSGANTSNPGRIGQVKKNIARINTLLKEKNTEAI